MSVLLAVQTICSVLTEVRRRHLTPLNWSYRQLGASGVEPWDLYRSNKCLYLLRYFSSL